MWLRACTPIVVIALWWHPTAATVQHRPARIVSLAPSVTEVLFEIGLGASVVGVTSYCRYPPAARTLPRIGGYLTPSYEAIARLRPDLAVVLPEHADIEPNLEALHVPLLRVDHGSIEGVIRSMVTLGERCGAEATALRAADRLRAQLASARQIARGSTRQRVFICMGRGDDFRGLYAAARGTIHDDLITLAGGENVLTSRAISYPTVSAEGLMRLDPDVILEFADERQDSASLRRQWNALGSLRAVKRARVHVFTQDFLGVPGPRFVRFAGVLARVLAADRAATVTQDAGWKGDDPR